MKPSTKRRKARVTEKQALELYEYSPEARRIVDEAAKQLTEEGDFKRLHWEMAHLPDNAATACPGEVMRVWGIYLGIRERVIKSVVKTGIQYRETLFYMHLWKTDNWNRFSKMRTKVYQQSAKYKAGRRKYEKVRGTERKNDPEYKARNALAKRLAYYGVTREEDLPEKSTKGRKSSTVKKEVRP